MGLHRIGIKLKLAIFYASFCENKLTEMESVMISAFLLITIKEI